MVADPVGKLYNKDALIEYFLDKEKYGDGDQICGYLKGVKVCSLTLTTADSIQDLLTLNLTDNPEYSPPASSTTVQTPLKAPFVCPLSLKEMNGAVPFIALRPCGCVFSDASIRAVIPNLTRGPKIGPKDDKPEEAKPVVEASTTVVCPNCGKELDPTLPTSISPINPPKEVQEYLLEQLLVSRATAKASKKRKAATDAAPVSKAAKLSPPHSHSPAPANGTPRTDSRVASVSKSSANRSTPPVTTQNTLNRSVHQKLAEQEQKRLASQVGMSDAVKAMFRPKEEGKKGGASEFFGRTFTRVSCFEPGR